MPRKRQLITKKTDNDSVIDQIERVVRWGDEFRLAFIKCNHPAQRETLRRALLERLSDQRVLEIALEKPIVSLLDEIRPLWNPDQPPVTVCIYGLEHSLREQGESSPVLGRLNHERDLLRQTIPAALLIWLSDFALDFVARGAPDFWAWRSGTYEFQTDSALWQVESIAAFGDHDDVSLNSLSWEDKQKEITRLEELLRTSQALIRQDKQIKQTNCRLMHQLGLLYNSLGRQDEALGCYQESLKLAKTLGDRASEGSILALGELPGYKFCLKT
jgi:tetratricopeptide (TPR) repeat protein